MKILNRFIWWKKLEKNGSAEAIDCDSKEKAGLARDLGRHPILLIVCV